MKSTLLTRPACKVNHFVLFVRCSVSNSRSPAFSRLLFLGCLLCLAVALLPQPQARNSLVQAKSGGLR